MSWDEAGKALECLSMWTMVAQHRSGILGDEDPAKEKVRT
jgi:hypothetical protein